MLPRNRVAGDGLDFDTLLDTVDTEGYRDVLGAAMFGLVVRPNPLAVIVSV
jgi:hypothetical protein